MRKKIEYAQQGKPAIFILKANWVILSTLTKTLLILMISTNLVLAEANPAVRLKQEVFPVTQDFINEAFGNCPVESEGGLHIGKGAITRVTLGPEALETEAEIIDYASIICPDWGLTAYCGSAGCPIYVAIDGTIKLGGHMQGWQLLKVGYETIILGYLHGSGCNGVGSMSCYAAYSWNGEGFLSLK